MYNNKILQKAMPFDPGTFATESYPEKETLVGGRGRGTHLSIKNFTSGMNSKQNLNS